MSYYADLGFEAITPETLRERTASPAVQRFLVEGVGPVSVSGIPELGRILLAHGAGAGRVRLPVVPLGWALSLFLALTYLVCIAFDLIFPMLGARACSDLLKKLPGAEVTAAERIKTDGHLRPSSLPNVFAAGDVADPGDNMTIVAVSRQLPWLKKTLTGLITGRKLADMKTQIAVGRAFVDRCMEKVLGEGLPADEAAMAKYFCSEMAFKVADDAVQAEAHTG